MCGIAGYYSLRQKVSDEILSSAAKSLQHRGPDNTNIWISNDQSLGLVHTRLSIIGLENGVQPLFSKDKSIVCVVNGEFYDYRIVKSDLMKKGYSFYTDSDSEIIIALYQEYGLDLFQHLNGEFAFILFDSIEKRIIAARDRFGIKPLYFSYYNSSLYIASEVKAILQMGLPSKWNAEAVANFCMGLPNQQISCFDNINLVKPGHYIYLNNNHLRQNKYWDMDFPEPAVIDQNSAVNEFKKLLVSAVHRRLIADVAVGCYLSGGLDSSAILALAAKENPNITALNISFKDDNAYDESYFAEKVAKFLGVNLSTLIVKQEDLALNYKEAIYYREALVYQISGIGKFLLSKFAREKGLKAVITGEGADELLFGYPSFKEDYLLNELSGQNKEIFLNKMKSENATSASAYISGKEFSILSDYKYQLGFTPSFIKLSAEIGNIACSIMNDDFLEKVKLFNPYKTFLDNEGVDAKKINGIVNKSSYLWAKSYFPELILSYLGDRMEMAHSIEGRLPFLDKDLVSFLCRLPVNLKIDKDLNEKAILRKAIQKDLPSEIWKRRKHIYSAPPIKKQPTSRTPIELLMHETFSSHRFKCSPFFDQEKVLKLLNNIPNLDARSVMITEFVLNLALSSYFISENFKL